MDMWFYQNGEQRQGPVPLEQLLATLVAAPNPYAVLVWQEGMTAWQQAGSVPEIGARLPPPMPAAVPLPSANRLAPLEDAEKMARLYRRLVLLIGGQVVLVFLRIQVVTAFPYGAVASIFLLVWIGLLLFTAVTAYQLVQQLREGTPLLWAIGMLIPCIGIFVLAELSSKAQRWCKQYGIEVGFFGPTRESIEAFRQRLLSSHFD